MTPDPDLYSPPEYQPGEDPGPDDVAHRIDEFREKYPQHSLRGDWRVHELAGLAFVAYRAEAYRTPDDAAPGVGSAWELVPGRTPYTRGSELQNAETSAWGRAIIAVGAADAKKGIASREEVEGARERAQVPVTGAEHERLRYGTVEPTPDDRPAERQRGPVDNPGDMWTDNPPPESQSQESPGGIGKAQIGDIGKAFRDVLGITDDAVRNGMISDMIGRQILHRTQLSRLEANFILRELRKRKEEQEAGA